MKISQVRTFTFGRAIRTRDSSHQTISKTIGLAVFASDSLSSVAYAGGEILLILAVLGASSFWLAIPITVAISLLLIILTFSYRQTIFAYPSGGGAYVVARDNLGETVAQAAGAALLIDYVLTVAVSIAAGVDQMASIFPVLFNYKVQLSLLLILFITLMNLRGIKESGRVFAVPTYWFVTMMLLLITVGLWQAFSGSLGTVQNVPGAHHPTASLTGFAFTFLILRAFSSGTTALTGVEAISNGITAFKAPKSRNAAATLVWDAALLMTMFLGLGILGYLVGAQPSEQEVLISQVARTVYGEGLMQALTLISATVILIMAANTSFADFPRLAALQAGDGFLPRQFTFRGSRLVFSWGVIILAAFASVLIVIFQGSVSRLIPLYAIGVFICFTLSQTGMAKRWLRIGRLMRRGELTPDGEMITQGSVIHHDRAWFSKMLLNGFGALITAIVALIFLVTKFTSGGWIIVVLIPAMVWLLFTIHHHYQRVARLLSAHGEKVNLASRPVETIVLVGDVHRETLRLVEFANSLGLPWKAVHIAVHEERVADIQRKWQERVGAGELVVLKSPYRSVTQPLHSYVKRRLKQNPGGYVHLVMGELRTGNPLSQILHQNAHFIEQLALGDLRGVITTVVPFPLEEFGGFNDRPDVLSLEVEDETGEDMTEVTTYRYAANREDTSQQDQEISA
jgi:amino acid transporter